MWQQSGFRLGLLLFVVDEGHVGFFGRVVVYPDVDSLERCNDERQFGSSQNPQQLQRLYGEHVHCIACPSEHALLDQGLVTIIGVEVIEAGCTRKAKELLD